MEETCTTLYTLYRPPSTVLFSIFHLPLQEKFLADAETERAAVAQQTQRQPAFPGNPSQESTQDYRGLLKALSKTVMGTQGECQSFGDTSVDTKNPA